MTPIAVGNKKSTMPLGKLSGRHDLQNKLREMGFYLNDEELNRGLYPFKSLADRKKNRVRRGSDQPGGDRGYL